jgi:hypothetical protein
LLISSHINIVNIYFQLNPVLLTFWYLSPTPQRQQIKELSDDPRERIEQENFLPYLTGEKQLLPFRYLSLAFFYVFCVGMSTISK